MRKRQHTARFSNGLMVAASFPYKLVRPWAWVATFEPTSRAHTTPPRTVTGWAQTQEAAVRLGEAALGTIPGTGWRRVETAPATIGEPK